MTDTMMTTKIIMTVMEDVIGEDVHVINIHITHIIRFSQSTQSIHHSTANHTIVLTATNINKYAC